MDYIGYLNQDPDPLLVKRIAAIGELTSIITMISPLPAFISCHKKPEEKVKMLDGISFNFLIVTFLLQSTCLAYILKAGLDEILVINVLTTITSMSFIVAYLHTKMTVERPYQQAFQFVMCIPYVHVIFSDLVNEYNTGLVATTFNVIIYIVLLDKVKLVLEEKDQSKINLPLTMACCLNASTWCLYSVLVKNAFLFIPNVVGICCSFLQVYLFLWTVNGV
jgi:uncharacterized protein with PQ loop repeat